MALRRKRGLWNKAVDHTKALEPGSHGEWIRFKLIPVRSRSLSRQTKKYNAVTTRIRTTGECNNSLEDPSV